MSQAWYYDFMNPEFALKRDILNGTWCCDFRYLKDIVNTRVGMFTYEGLEKSVRGLTSQILECALMFGSCLCFYHSKGTDEWILGRYLKSGNFDRYMRPTFVDIQALNGEPLAHHVAWEDIILVRDNTMDIPAFLPIKEYVEKIRHIENDLFKMVDVACLPLMVIGSKKASNQLKTVAKQLTEYNPFIVGDDNIVDNIKAFPINLPFEPLDIYDLKKKYLNECMSSLGIYSVDEKRERIVTQELVNQNDYTDFIYMNALMERERFVRELNEKGGFSIKVIETYDVNYDAGIDEKSRLAKEMTEAQIKGVKNTAPELLENATYDNAVPKMKGTVK